MGTTNLRDPGSPPLAQFPRSIYGRERIPRRTNAKLAIKAKKFTTMNWEAGIFLSVRFIHDYPAFSPREEPFLPSEVVDELERANVKIERSEEFLRGEAAARFLEKIDSGKK